MFRVGVHDTTEEGELDKVEAEVGIFGGEAAKEGKVGAVMARLCGGGGDGSEEVVGGEGGLGECIEVWIQSEGIVEGRVVCRGSTEEWCNP